MNECLNYYKSLLIGEEIPDFLKKYLYSPSLERLKKIGYFCGMDYASKDIYDFKELITRYDHSLTVALMTYRLTHDKKSTIAALFHDIATPCFSHVIDYMNNDFANQESTEEYTKDILLNDLYLLMCLNLDDIEVDDIADFKRYSIVDNNRPMVCADRLDGVILTGMAWTKNINTEDIYRIINDIKVTTNELGREEICFQTYDIAKKVLEVSESIDVACHSNEDNYMMMLLADIVRTAIEYKVIEYKDLYTYTEEELINVMLNSNIRPLLSKIKKFQTITKEEIEILEIEGIKVRDLNPLVNSNRLKSI